MVVYHYCSIDTFDSILAGKKFWLTPIDGTTDESEMIHLYRKSWRRIKARLMEDGINIYTPMFAILEHEIKHIAVHTYKPYLTCFSKDGDLLSQWREYGGRATGVSLGIDLSELNVMNDIPHPNKYLEKSIGVGEVVYDYDQQDMILKSIILEIIENGEGNALDWMTILSNFKHYSGVFKNRTFFEEKEVRIIYYPSNGHRYRNEHVDGPFEYKNGLDRYEICWYRNPMSHAVRSVVIGPKCQLSIDDIKMKLDKAGVYVGEIAYSESTYR